MRWLDEMDGWLDEMVQLDEDEMDGWLDEMVQLDGHEFEQAPEVGWAGKPGVLQSMGLQRVGHD